MREALARSDHDFVLYERPQGRTQQRGRIVAASRRNAFASRLMGLVLHRPSRTLGVVLAGGFAVAVAVNALVLQPRPHPAPLFTARGSEGPVRTAPPARTAPQPAAVVDTAAPAPAAVAEPAPPSRPSALTQHLMEGSGEVMPRPRPADPIGDLIRTGLGGGGGDKAVLDAQKALAKLGYGVTPDGLWGPQTRQAIEQFERDRGLPVAGELTDKMRSLLAAAAGNAGR
ncbi:MULTISPECIES: peptidoglycan-binding protein [unclassified Chelatococcus]|uniref:peptidoglycan-binding domain-containing protein n=1 Tax=unclassified Chelatococcus TaxID=2638111 RepID=UPI0002ECA89B|nr:MULTISPECIES: peptidoglycan-binding domain-containing protein [unclassified Chelatococcus]